MGDNHNQPMQPASALQAPTAHVSSKEFAAKYRSKREVYNFLATDVGVYLPPYDNVTIYFLKELIGDHKKTLSTAQIRTVHIPQ